MKATQILQLDDGSEPFTEWYELLEMKVQARVSAFIDRVAAGGGKKNVRSLGNGVYEIKIDLGPGYRTAKRYGRQYEKK